MKKYQKILLFTACLILVFVTYRYYEFKKYVNVYNNSSGLLAERIEYYTFSRQENVPSNNLEFKNMINWLDSIESIDAILDYGMSFKFDSLNQIVTLYSFGFDKKDDGLHKLLYSTSVKPYTVFGENEIIENWSIHDIFNTKSDVLLLKAYIEDDFLCNKYKNDDLYHGLNLTIAYSSSYIFFQKNKKVTGTLEKRLRNKINKFKKSVFINDSTELYFMKFKYNKIKIVCSDNTNKDRLGKNIKKILTNNSIDYAIIPILENN